MKTVELKWNDNIAPRLRRENIAKTEAIATEIKDKAKGMTPVLTGYLKEHIVVEKKSEEIYDIVSEADYSLAIEYGTSKQSAQPFLRPAVEQVRKI